MVFGVHGLLSAAHAGVGRALCGAGGQLLGGGLQPGIGQLSAQARIAGREVQIDGAGTGPIDAFVDGLAAATGHRVRVLDYHEHAIGAGANAKAVAYLELRVDENRTLFGVGIDANIVSASLKAIVSGLERATREQHSQTDHNMAVAR